MVNVVNKQSQEQLRIIDLVVWKNGERAILFVCRKELMEQISLGKEDHQQVSVLHTSYMSFSCETEDFKNDEKILRDLGVIMGR